MAKRKVRLGQIQRYNQQRVASGTLPSRTSTRPGGGQRLAQQRRDTAPSPRAMRAQRAQQKDDAKAQDKGGGGGGGGGFSISDALGSIGSLGGKALEAIDVPRAYAVSGLKELQDVAKSVVPDVEVGGASLKDMVAEGALQKAARLAGAGLDQSTKPVTKKARTSDASVEQFLGQAKRHAGSGELFIDKPGLSSGNGMVDTALGLSGDVLADPLTYIGVGALSKGERVANALQKAGVVGEAAGDVEKASRFKQAAASVLRDKSVRNVGSDVLQDVGLPRKGFTFAGSRIPGTEGAYQAASYLPNKLRTSLGDLRDTVTGGARTASGASAVGDATTRSLKAMERLGPDEADKALEASTIRRADATARSRGKGIASNYANRYDKLLKQAKKRGAENQVLAAMHGDEGAIASLGDDIHGPMRELFDEAHKAATDSGVDVGYIDQFFREMSDKLAELKGGKRKLLSDAQYDMTKGRKLKEGTELTANGETVTLSKNPDEQYQQITEFYNKHHGIDPFKTDVSDVGHRYFDSVSKKIARGQAQQRMIDEGLVPQAKQLVGEVPKKGQKGKITKATKKAEAARAEMLDAEAAASAARQGISPDEAGAAYASAVSGGDESRAIDALIGNFEQRDQQGLLGMGAHDAESVARTNAALAPQREVSGLEGAVSAEEEAIRRLEAGLEGAKGRKAAIEGATGEMPPPLAAEPAAPATAGVAASGGVTDLSPEAQAVLDELKAAGLTGGVPEARAARQVSPEDLAAVQSETPWNKIPKGTRERLGEMDVVGPGETPVMRTTAGEQPSIDEMRAINQLEQATKTGAEGPSPLPRTPEQAAAIDNAAEAVSKARTRYERANQKLHMLPEETEAARQGGRTAAADRRVRLQNEAENLHRNLIDKQATLDRLRSQIDEAPRPGTAALEPAVPSPGVQPEQGRILGQAQADATAKAENIATDRIVQANQQVGQAAEGAGIIADPTAQTLIEAGALDARKQLEQAEAWYKRKYPAAEQAADEGLSKARKAKIERLTKQVGSPKAPGTLQYNSRKWFDAKKELDKLMGRLGKPGESLEGVLDKTRVTGGEAARRADAAAQTAGFNTVDEWVTDARQQLAKAESGRRDPIAQGGIELDLSSTVQAQHSENELRALEHTASIEGTLAKYGLNVEDVTPRGLKMAEDEIVRQADALDAAKVKAGELRSKLADAQSRVAHAGRSPEGLPPVPEGHVRLYRGEYEGPAVETGLHTPPGARGRWFTDDPEMARVYSHVVPTNSPFDEVLHATKPDGPLYYVDVPADVAKKTQRNGWQNLLPEQFAQKKVPANAQASFRLRSEVGQHLELAAQTDDMVVGHLHSLAADAKAAEAKAIESRSKWLSLDEQQRALKSEPGQKIFKDLVQESMRQQIKEYPDLALDPEVSRAYTLMQDALRPGKKGFVTSYYDRALNWWKGWAIASPGFVMRNIQGGLWNNYLAGVDVGAHLDWLRLARADGAKGVTGSEKQLESVIGKIAKSRGIEPQKVKDAWEEVKLFAHQGQAPSEFIKGSPSSKLLGPGTRLNPLSSSNIATGTMRKVNQGAEDFLRGSMGLDTILKGGTSDDAMDLISKFHFDYEDLSKFERALKRVVPFYTWNRHNLPLQFEQLVKQPGKFNKYTIFKQEMERHSVADPLVPDYFKEGGAIRLPIQRGGGHLYILPELPFKDVINPPNDLNDVMGYAAPTFKTPIEYALGKQFFKGIPLDDKLKQSPDSWGSVMPLLGAAGLADKRSGDWYMTNKNAYLVEQAFPFLGRARRLKPSEPAYQQRVTSSWVSFLGGIGARTNTTTEQQYTKLGRMFDRATRMESNAITDKQRIRAARARKEASRWYATHLK